MTRPAADLEAIEALHRKDDEASRRGDSGALCERMEDEAVRPSGHDVLRCQTGGTIKNLRTMRREAPTGETIV